MKIDVIDEIVFSTARSGGKGGQNVNKVETMVEGRWNIEESSLFSGDEKQRLIDKLANKITSKGFLLIKSQTARTQMENKENVVKKINSLIAKALTKKKARISTKPSKASKEKRIEEREAGLTLKAGAKRLAWIIKGLYSRWYYSTPPPNIMIADNLFPLFLFKIDSN